MEEIFRHLPQLETERLILRKVTMDDCRDVFEYASDPAMTRFVSWEHHRSIDDSARILQSLVEKYRTGEVSDWGVALKDTNRLIGTCGFVWWNRAHCRAEMAYALSRKYWNRGLMTEAVGRVISFGFEVMTLNRIEARCFMENLASQRVLEKAGMIFEGIMRESLRAKGTFHDMKLYSLLKKDYHLRTLTQ